MLKERGVRDVRALVGGWNQWVSDGNKVVKGEKP
jgi:3-mercaptopyruvate sulfurtransferase SseA